MGEKIRSTWTIAPRTSVKRACWVLLVWVVAIIPAEPSALGALRHPSVEESVTGTAGILGPAFSLGPGAGLPAVLVQVSEEAMYGIPGLHTSGATVGFGAAGGFVTAEAAQLSSSVGSEKRLALTPALVTSAWAVSAGIVYDGVTLVGMESAKILSVNVRSLIWITKTLRLGGEIDRLRLAGEELPGADVKLVVLSIPAQNISLHGTIELGRRTGFAPGAAVTVDELGPARLSFGYEGGTEALKASVFLEWRTLGLAAGVYYHPVLGEKREITLTWSG